MTQLSEFENELQALRVVLSALEPLDDQRRQFVLRSAAERFSITFYQPEITKLDKSTTQLNVDGEEDQSTTQSPIPGLEDFVFLKKTGVDAQRVAVLAYYLLKYRNQPSFKPTDLLALNREAAGRPFGNLIKITNNATVRDGFLGQAGRGFKRLAPLGIRVVEALPDVEKVRALIKEHKPPIRTKAKKRVLKIKEVS